MNDELSPVVESDSYKRPVKPKPPPWFRFKFSLSASLWVVAAIVILFFVGRELGAYGFVIGCFLVMIAFGQFYKVPNMRFGGIAGVVTLIGSLTLAYFNFGQVGTIQRDLYSKRHFMNSVEAALREHHEQFGIYPIDLSDIQTQQPELADSVRYVVDSENDYFYLSDGERFQFLCLGGDKKLGGEGVDGDFNVANWMQHFESRVTFDQFLHGTRYWDGQRRPSGVGMTLIFSLLVALIFTTKEVNLPGDWRVRLALAVPALGGAVFVGGMLAGFHIAASQSGH